MIYTIQDAKIKWLEHLSLWQKLDAAFIVDF